MLKNVFKSFRNVNIWLGIFLTLGCNNAPRQQKPILTLSVPPQEYFVRQLAGDRYDINVLIRPGADHDNYEPTPEQIMKLSQSKAFIGIGTLGFELAWHDKLQTLAQKVPFYFMKLPAGGHTHTHEGHCHEDPHIWLSGEGATQMAEETARALIEIDPGNKPLIDARLAVLLARIDSVQQVWDSLLSPFRGSGFIIYHPSLTWYAPAFGLHQLALEEEGKPLSPAHMAGIIDSALIRNIRVVLVQPEYNRENATVVAREIGATVHTIDPMGADWVAVMDSIGRVLLNGFTQSR